MLNKIKKVLLIFLILLMIIHPVYAEEEYENNYNEEQPTEEIEEINETEEDNTTENEEWSESIPHSLYINPTTKYEIHLYDDADLLSDDEEKNLIEDMQPLTEFGHIAFQSIDNNDMTTASYARERYHSLFSTESGTLFLIDMDNRYIYIFSDGGNYVYLTNSKADIITDNIYRYASAGKYYECSKKAYEQMYTILSGGKIAEPMRHASNLVISIVVAFFTSFIVIMSQSKIKKASNTAILKNCDITFDISNVTSTKTGTHRVYSPPSDSSSGGSSGGGGGGGGGSSGGGGGHGF